MTSGEYQIYASKGGAEEEEGRCCLRKGLEEQVFMEKGQGASCCEVVRLFLRKFREVRLNKRITRSESDEYIAQNVVLVEE